MTIEELQALAIKRTQTMLKMAERQSRSIELQRSRSAQMLEDAIELSAISQRAAAATREQGALILAMSVNTLRGLETQKQNIDRLEKMVEIIVKDNQADRERIRNLENRS